jgi:hypothetical protein
MPGNLLNDGRNLISLFLLGLVCLQLPVLNGGALL